MVIFAEVQWQSLFLRILSKNQGKVMIFMLHLLRQAMKKSEILFIEELQKFWTDLEYRIQINVPYIWKSLIIQNMII